MKKSRVTLTCVCGKSFEVKSGRVNTAKYCSRACRAVGMQNHRPFNWKGGRLKHKGYVYLLTKGHPFGDRDGYVSEHRLVMEKSLGRFLEKEEVVHHRNGKRGDNRLENLELHESQSSHMKEHHPKGTPLYAKMHPRIGAKHTEETKRKMKEAWRLRKEATSAK